MTRRKRRNDVKTGRQSLTRDKLWRNPLTARAASGIKVAPVRFRLGCGTWEKIRDRLQVGDVLAYRIEKWSARREIFLRGDLTFVGYRLFKYGHLAIVVADPLDPGKKVLFTSQSFKGVNVDEDLDTLRTHNWDAYRLDRWERIDKQRFSQYVDHCRNAAGHFTGYDFLVCSRYGTRT